MNSEPAADWSEFITFIKSETSEDISVEAVKKWN